MKIERSGLICKVAYGMREDRDIPPGVPICRLFWRFLFLLLIGWPLFFTFAGIVLGSAFLIGFFIGRRPAIFEEDVWGAEAYMGVRYQRWPTIRGVRILPLPVLLVLGLIYEVPGLAQATFHMLQDFCSFAATRDGLLFWSAMLALGVVLWLLFRFPKTQFGQLAKAFIKAKWQKVCPMVEIT